MSATAPHPEPGDVIEEYEILERIGGNLGFVFKARHRLLDKVIVLKLVPTECITDPARLARFQREVRVMGQLEHPNLVTAADARSVDNWHLVAMEWIDGTDLQQLLRARGPLPVAAACEAARQAAQALQYGHEHGLIHRDIKPSNLMLTRSGSLKVIDMGLALIREDSAAQLTKTGLVLGTMSYCAPEQFRDASHVDIRADIYSLGCTLYHLLTGKPPYSERKSFAEVVEAHLHEPFPGLAEAGSDVPAGLEAVLTRMTAKDRDARFSTPGEVVDALEPFARGADLRPLVPERIPQAPTAEAKTVKVTSKREGQRRAAAGEPQPKARWTRRDTFVGLGGAVATGAAIFATNRLTRNSVLPGVVVLMDSPEDRARYDEELRGTRKTNAEVIQNRVLDTLPLSCVPFPISEDASKRQWRGENNVIKLRPGLVLFHRSAFFHPANKLVGLGYPDEPDWSPEKQDKWDYMYGMSDEKLVCFMGQLATVLPGIKFLIYSRGTDKNWSGDKFPEEGAKFREGWKRNCEERFPVLKDCVDTMLINKPDPPIPGSEKGSFKDHKTAQEVRTRVKKLLGLP